jgi:hypothetical protein
VRTSAFDDSSPWCSPRQSCQVDQPPPARGAKRFLLDLFNVEH